MTKDRRELELLIRSRIPLIIIETHEENRVLDMIRALKPGVQHPLFSWSVTEGLIRLEWALVEEGAMTEPDKLLKYIKSHGKPGIFVLRDFHPYLSDPVNVRLLKDIALNGDRKPHTLILLSHSVEVPDELRKHTAKFSLSMPSREAIEQTVDEIIASWRAQGAKIEVDEEARRLLVNNLSGIALRDVRKLASSAILDDGALTSSDIPRVMRAKHALLAGEGVLQFEFETTRFRDVGGFRNLKQWLVRRQAAFLEPAHESDRPKGLMMLGVQGCGKSLAAKAVAGTWGVPLLRLDFGAIYDKYYGETEKNLREALATAEALAPCVLWIDEIEKGISGGHGDDGLSRRVLGSLLTWMAEQRAGVFVVATANDIQALPPELVRKGRFDEIFFVDLPDESVRRDIFRIHCERREISISSEGIARLAACTHGYSGAEIEQAVISARYAGSNGVISEADIQAELNATRPLAVVMREKIEALRVWASDRTVPADVLSAVE